MQYEGSPGGCSPSRGRDCRRASRPDCQNSASELMNSVSLASWPCGATRRCSACAACSCRVCSRGMRRLGGRFYRRLHL